MARPWQENLLKHNIAQILRDEGIGMVLNLQVGRPFQCGLPATSQITVIQPSISCHITIPHYLFNIRLLCANIHEH